MNNFINMKKNTMVEVLILKRILLGILLVFLIGCAAQPDTVTEPEMETEEEFEEEKEPLVIDVTPKYEHLVSFTLKSECRRKYHVARLFHNITRLPDNVTLQLRKNNEPVFTDFVTQKPAFEKENLIYFCNVCPIEAELKLPEEDDFYVRLMFDIEGEQTYTDALFFSTKPDSEWYRQVACSTKELTGCIDSEETRNYKTRGVINFGQEEYIEDCVDEVHTDEYWCEDGEVKHEVVECKNRCWLGRCAEYD